MTKQELKNRFTYHAPKGNQAERYGQLREAALKFATYACALTPESREQTRALNKVDEAVMLFNAAIARNE